MAYDCDHAKPVTPAVQYPITDHTHYSSEVTAIGYGVTAVGAQDEGVRRIKQNIAVTCIPGDTKLPCAREEPRDREDGSEKSGVGESVEQQVWRTEIGGYFPM